MDGGLRRGYGLAMDGEPHDEADPAAAIDLGPLPALVGYALRRAQLVVFADFHRAFTHLRLGPAQYGVLLLLRHNPGIRASAVAAALGIQRANFTALLARLEQSGFVERRAVPRDRRAAALHLSAAGSALLVEADRAQERHERRLRRHLSDADVQRLMELLGRIRM